MMIDFGSPKVSVVCAWYNRADYIKDTVDSLLQQSFESYEVIIANDGSTDPKVKQILDSYKDPRLKVIHKDNEGFTKTITMLVELAKAPYVAVQGAGEVSLPNRLAVQYEFLKENPEYGMVGCASVNVIKRDGRTDEVLRKNEVEHGEVVYDLNRTKHPFTHGSIMYNKMAYFDVGGYRQVFKYAQDYDLFLRMIERHRCYNFSEVLYVRNIFLDGVSTSPIKSFEQSMFVKFAKRCSSLRQAFGVDIIDRFGLMSFALYKIDAKDLKGIAAVIFKLVYISDLSAAHLFISLQGRGFVFRSFKMFISVLGFSPRAHKIVRLMIKKAYKNSVFLRSND